MLGWIAQVLARWLHQLAARLEAAAARAAAASTGLAALAEQFPGAPEHWLATVAEHLAVPSEDAHHPALVESASVAPEEPAGAAPRGDRQNTAHQTAPRKRRPPLRFFNSSRSTPNAPMPARRHRHTRQLVTFEHPVREERLPLAFAGPKQLQPTRFETIHQPANEDPARQELIMSARPGSPGAEAVAWLGTSQSARPKTPSEPVGPTEMPPPEMMISKASQSTPPKTPLEPVAPTEMPPAEMMISKDARDRRSEIHLVEPTRGYEFTPSFAKPARATPFVATRRGPERLDWPELPPSDRIADTAATSPRDADFRHEQMAGLWSG